MPHISSTNANVVRTANGRQGVEKFDKIGIISNNRWEWAAIGAAAYSLNASFVPMYEAQLAKDWKYIINDSGLKFLFCATQGIYDKVGTEVLPSTPNITATLCLDAKLGEGHAFATALDLSTEDKEGTLVNAPTGEDLAHLIYTSGTTGTQLSRSMFWIGFRRFEITSYF